LLPKTPKPQYLLIFFHLEILLINFFKMKNIINFNQILQ